MRRLAAALALVLAAPSAVPGQVSPPVNADLADVRRLINAGDAAAALERLRALEGGTDPAQRTQLVLLMGVAYYHAGNPAKAIDALVGIVDQLPPDSIDRREADQILGLTLFLVGRYAEAVPRLEATRRWAADNAELAHALGQAYIHIQRPDAARDVFAGLYRVPPDSAAAHLLAAQMMVRLELDVLAESELGKALAKDPRVPHANFLLGQIALFRGRLPEAVTLTERELAVNPANALAFSQLGDAFVRQGKWTEAIAVLQKSVWLNPYYSAPYILLGRAYMKNDQPSPAEAMLRRAIQYDPNNRAAHYVLAQVLQQMGRADEAKREFETAERLTSTRGQ